MQSEVRRVCNSERSIGFEWCGFRMHNIMTAHFKVCWTMVGDAEMGCAVSQKHILRGTGSQCAMQNCDAQCGTAMCNVEM